MTGPTAGASPPTKGYGKAPVSENQSACFEQPRSLPHAGKGSPIVAPLGPGSPTTSFAAAYDAPFTGSQFGPPRGSVRPRTYYLRLAAPWSRLFVRESLWRVMLPEFRSKATRLVNDCQAKIAVSGPRRPVPHPRDARNPLVSIPDTHESVLPITTDRPDADAVTGRSDELEIVIQQDFTNEPVIPNIRPARVRVIQLTPLISHG